MMSVFVRTPSETRLLIPVEYRGMVAPVEVESVRVVDATPRQGVTPSGLGFWYVVAPLDQFTAEQVASLRRQMALQHDVPLEIIERLPPDWLAVLVDPGQMLVIEAEDGAQATVRLVPVRELSRGAETVPAPTRAAWWRRLGAWWRGWGV